MALAEIIDETKLVSCSADSSVSEVADLMRSRDVGTVLIVDEDRRPVGIVTDRDLVTRCLSEGLDYSTLISQIMTPAPQTIFRGHGIAEAVERMRRAEVRRLPVVDESGRAVAVISFGDVFRLLADELHDLTSAAAPEDRKIVA